MTQFKFIISIVIISAILGPPGGIADTPQEKDIKQQLSFGVRAARDDHWDEAIFRWQKVLLMDPDNLMAHNNLAVAYEQLGEYSQAMEEYEAAYRLNSQNEAVKNNLERFKEFYRKYQQRQKP